MQTQQPAHNTQQPASITKKIKKPQETTTLSIQQKISHSDEAKGGIRLVRKGKPLSVETKKKLVKHN